ncbi:MAG: amidohydrolase family protein [Gemmatimonadota bacterium]|nr:amidohydrolase family protein [Gemmatimonadota bacterium]
MLIDVHAHFLTELCGRSDWTEINEARIDAGEKIGITAHVASILGTFGHRSPTYFPSPEDVSHGNERMYEMTRQYPGLVFAYCVVNPNYQDHAKEELNRWLDEGFVGVKLAASRRANDPLVDVIAEVAGERGVPVLHHIWQHRRKEWPGQEASDAVELCELALRHPNTKFLLAHIGGGGDWSHSLRVVEAVENVFVDLSGSGVDSGMLQSTLASVGPARIVWGADVTLDTGLAKLRYLSRIGLSEETIENIKWKNAANIFPEGIFTS